MENIFDTHAHYTDRRFDADRDAALASQRENGVALALCCGSDLPDSEQALILARQYPWITAACGIHPHEASGAGAHALEELRALLQDPRCVAVGEIGLDYHYDFSPREAQRDCFRRQMALALELDMPVVVHDREAHEDTLQILRVYPVLGEIRCFSGSADCAREILKQD